MLAGCFSWTEIPATFGRQARQHESSVYRALLRPAILATGGSELHPMSVLS
jgi:hypothetical protein